MKVYLTFLLLLLGSAASAQQTPFNFSPLPLSPTTNRAVYSAVVPVTDTTKDQLFSRAQQWVSQITPVYKASIRQIHPETGALQFRGRIKQGQESFGFQLAVSVEDGSYTYQLDNITRTQPQNPREGKYSSPTPQTVPIEALVYTRPRKSRDKKLTEVDTRLRAVLASLNLAMQGKPARLTTQL
ncbi:DUF4468 domain-containing protein [Hymenobacter sp.]|jgi:hypothetical protein|uniref:DUF4468 domain-containing protein n=1 Tax=Hymenobacter sp. TaxID=1898978 RepID=UPI002EDA5264